MNLVLISILEMLDKLVIDFTVFCQERTRTVKTDVLNVSAYE